MDHHVYFALKHAKITQSSFYLPCMDFILFDIHTLAPSDQVFRMQRGLNKSPLCARCNMHPHPEMSQLLDSDDMEY